MTERPSSARAHTLCDGRTTFGWGGGYIYIYIWCVVQRFVSPRVVVTHIERSSRHHPFSTSCLDTTQTSCVKYSLLAPRELPSPGHASSLLRLETNSSVQHSIEDRVRRFVSSRLVPFLFFFVSFSFGWRSLVPISNSTSFSSILASSLRVAISLPWRRLLCVSFSLRGKFFSCAPACARVKPL